MSETNGIQEPQSRNGTGSRPAVLPQWALDFCRPIVGFLSRIFWRVRWLNTECIPATGGLIIASNHQTYVDPFWISAPIKRTARYLAWAEAFNWPLVGPLLSLFGAWPLQLEGSDPAPIRRSIEWVRDGGAMVIFPEGGRGMPDGSMRKFKAGAVRMALESGVPILPVTIRGGEAVWPNTFRFPRFAKRIDIIYHPIVRVEQRENESVRDCARRETENLAEVIKSTL